MLAFRRKSASTRSESQESARGRRPLSHDRLYRESGNRWLYMKFSYRSIPAGSLRCWRVSQSLYFDVPSTLMCNPHSHTKACHTRVLYHAIILYSCSNLQPNSMHPCTRDGDTLCTYISQSSDTGMSTEHKERCQCDSHSCRTPESRSRLNPSVVSEEREVQWTDPLLPIITLKMRR